MKTEVNGLIVFFMLFKAVGGIIHLPFVNQLERVLIQIIPNNTNETLGIDNIDPKLGVHTKAAVLMKDLEYFYQTHVELIKQRFANPSSYSEEIYYNQKEKYDKLFQFAIQYQDNPMLVDRLQETMQALKLSKDTMKSFTKVEELLDGDAKAYLKELHIQVDDIFVTLET